MATKIIKMVCKTKEDITLKKQIKEVCNKTDKYEHQIVREALIQYLNK